MNFVTELPSIKKKNVILIIVDRFIKMKYFIVTTAEASIQTVIDLYMNNIYWFYKFSDIIISDYNSQFIAFFWKTLCLWLSTNCLLSTVFHSESDKQIKILNIFIKQYLCAYTFY